MSFFSWHSARPGGAGRGPIDCRKHAAPRNPIAFIHMYSLQARVPIGAMEMGHQ